MWSGGPPGTGATIRGTGVPGEPITGTITMGTIIIGITGITPITVTGTATGAGTIILTIAVKCAFIALLWL